MKWGFDAPKEFGDRSDVGLGKLHGLHGVDIPFAKSNPDEDTVVVKGNGFNTVTKKPRPTGVLGRYVSVGRFAGNTVGTVTQSRGLHAPFLKQLTSGGISLNPSAITLGKRRTLIFVDIFSSGVILISRFSDVSGKTLELSTFLTVPTGAAFFVTVTGNACYYRSAPGAPPIEYETATHMQLDGNNVFPKVFYSDPTGWHLASTQGYDTYDHYAYFGYQLRPNVHLIAHAVVPRGVLWGLGTRDPTPNGQAPYPLFQISVDCARTYTPLNLDYLFAQSTFEYVVPRVAGTVGVSGAGGYSAIFGIAILSLADALFFSLEVPVDAPTPLSIFRSGYNFECRIFKSNGLDLTSMVQISNPPGYGTVWSGALIAAFAETQPSAPPRTFGIPGGGFDAIGYVALAVDFANPNMLFVSFDQGATWEPPRNLPAIGRWCLVVNIEAARQLGCNVYEPTTPPQVVRYYSTDYGLTWVRGQVLASGVIDITASGNLADFLYILPITQDDGSLDTADPMAGWRYDSRIPRFVATHSHSF